MLINFTTVTRLGTDNMQIPLLVSLQLQPTDTITPGQPMLSTSAVKLVIFRKSGV